MPLTLTCSCGKSLQVADQYAGRRVKCPGCGATQTAEQPAPRRAAADPPGADSHAEFDDFEVVEESGATAAPTTSQAAASTRPRVKAVASEEPEPPAPPQDAPPAKSKKKKKKKKANNAEEGDWYEQMREREARVKRAVRGTAFIVLGALIVIGVAIAFLGYREELKELGGRTMAGLLVLGGVGVAAVGKGVIGLVFGQFLGEDD